MRSQTNSFAVLLGRVLLWLALLATGNAWAVDPILVDGRLERIPLANVSAFWIDNTGQLGPEEVAQREQQFAFAPRADGQVHQIEGRALWIRFDAQITDTNKRWLLEVLLPGVDLAELFYRKHNGDWVRQMAGDSLPISAWPQSGRNPVFALATDVGTTVRYYVRIQHARVPFSAPLAILSHTQVTYEHERDHLLLGVYFGLAVLVVVVAGSMGIAYRDNAFASYAAYVGLLALAQAAFTGVAGQYLWPERPVWANASVFLLPMLAAAAAMLFVRNVISPKQFAKALDRFMLAMALLMILSGVIDAVVPTVEGFTVNNTLISASMVLLILVVALAVFEGDPHARWVALGLSPVVLAALLQLLRNFGLIPTSLLTQYGLMFGSALEAPILFYGLYQRLSQRREADVRSRALAQNDPLTGLSHTRVLMRRLQDALLRARRYQQQCAFLLVDFTNYPSIQQNHGREAAERSLVVAASRLRVVIRDIDTAARIGEHLFALLLEAPAADKDLLAVATHAVARGLRDSPVLPPGETLRFRVVVALLPWDDYNAEQVVDWMRAGLHAMDPKSTKTIHPLNF